MALYTILNVLLFSVGISAKPLSTKSMWHWRLCQKVEMAEALSSKLDQFFFVSLFCFVFVLFFDIHFFNYHRVFGKRINQTIWHFH